MDRTPVFAQAMMSQRALCANNILRQRFSNSLTVPSSSKLDDYDHEIAHFAKMRFGSVQKVTCLASHNISAWMQSSLITYLLWGSYTSAKQSWAIQMLKLNTPHLASWYEGQVTKLKETLKPQEIYRVRIGVPKQWDLFQLAESICQGTRNSIPWQIPTLLFYNRSQVTP